MTNGQKIRAHRERKRLTALQCAVRAKCPHEVWLGLENDEPLDVAPELRVFIDKFTDGEVAWSPDPAQLNAEIDKTIDAWADNWKAFGKHEPPHD